MSPQRQPKAGDMIRLSISVPPPVYDDIKAESLDRDMSFSGIVVERLEELADLKRASSAEWRERLEQASNASTKIETVEARARIPGVLVTIETSPEEQRGVGQDSPPVRPPPPRIEPHEGHDIRGLGYMRFCETCKVRVP